MTSLLLPPKIGMDSVVELPPTRQVSLVGGNGAGKTRFMEELMRLVGDHAVCLSALKAGFPQREVSTLPGSVDSLYRDAVRMQPYMRTDAVSEIDKLTYMLFTDEFEYLMSVKEQTLEGNKIHPQPTRLDQLQKIWESIFPENRIRRCKGRLEFSTGAGDDLIPITALSQGEQAVFYYIAGALYAPPDSVIFIDNPSLFIHSSILNNLWNSIEDLRADCTFVYDSVDADFVSTRTSNTCVWIKNYDSSLRAWDYEIVPADNLPDDIFVGLIGSRRPVLFIEGDARHSIDAKLYTLVFQEYSVRPLGSCDKVIETTRSFNDLKYMHHLASRGIVDRDRRTAVEVDYLRRKNIMVPEVAEVENIFLLEDVIRVMARRRGRNPDTVFSRVRKEVLRMFKQHAEEQALMHVRHKVKREVECKIDGKFSCITAMETHIRSLVHQLRPRENYVTIRSEFERMVREQDYAGILRVFNHKPMLGDCSVAHLLGYANKDAYISGVLDVLKGNGRDALALRASVKYCFGLQMDNTYAREFQPSPKVALKASSKAAKEDYSPDRSKTGHSGQTKKKKKYAAKKGAAERRSRHRD